jgi:secreted PhoX family phosphatase
MKDFDDACCSNASANPHLLDLPSPARRQVLAGSLGAAALAGLPLPAAAVSAAAGAGRAIRTARPAMGFDAIAVSREDRVQVPPGYRLDLLFAWGDPLFAGPAFHADASNTAGEQAVQAGMHHDGMHFFPFVEGKKLSSTHGLLCINHEYTDDGLLHPGGMRDWSAEKVAKSQAAHGVSVIEVKEEGGRWQLVRPSAYARRITAQSAITVSGPAAGRAGLKTAQDPHGRLIFGTFNNCAMGHTPWGTYLTCEENFNGYFKAGKSATPDEKRYGINDKTAGYRWHEFDERFDAAKHPNEPHRFGWVVEIDPWNPMQPPVKRTALGRIKHEGATVTLAADGRVVVYMGDDERFEYIYKYVSKGIYQPGDRAANASLLDEGTLYVAKFGEEGRGRWVALEHGKNGLTRENGFADQAQVLIRTRQAADQVGATKMDRPEWIAVHPKSGEVYVSLTNNVKRGTSEVPGLNAANPRADNVFGHIVRWREVPAKGKHDAGSLDFEWDIFLLAGDPQHPDAARRGNIQGDAFGSPDGLWFDAEGRLWIQTDVSTSVLNQGDYANLGNNQMLVADVVTGQVKRFLTGPRGCEISGITSTPDGKTLFVNIQHPGEPASERSDPEKATAISHWPHGQFPETPAGRPRSGTVVIRREDGGVVGS